MGQFERDIQDRVECIMRKRESVERRLIRGSVLILNSKSNIGRLKAREREREMESESDKKIGVGDSEFRSERDLGRK